MVISGLLEKFLAVWSRKHWVCLYFPIFTGVSKNIDWAWSILLIYLLKLEFDSTGIQTISIVLRMLPHYYYIIINFDYPG